MVGSKSREDLTKFDNYRCLTCDTTIREPPALAPKRDLRNWGPLRSSTPMATA
jgi:hypothetical protein